MRTPSYVQNSRTPAAFGTPSIPKRYVERAAGQALNPALAQNCSYDFEHNAVYLVNGTNTALPDGAVGCDVNGNPVNAAGAILATSSQNLPSAQQFVTNTTNQFMQPQNTIYWYAAGAVALLAVGAIIYSSRQQQAARNNPRRGHHHSRRSSRRGKR